MSFYIGNSQIDKTEKLIPFGHEKTWRDLFQEHNRIKSIIMRILQGRETYTIRED